MAILGRWHQAGLIGLHAPALLAANLQNSVFGAMCGRDAVRGVEEIYPILKDFIDDDGSHDDRALRRRQRAGRAGRDGA